MKIQHKHNISTIMEELENSINCNKNQAIVIEISSDICYFRFEQPTTMVQKSIFFLPFSFETIRQKTDV